MEENTPALVPGAAAEIDLGFGQTLVCMADSGAGSVDDLEIALPYYANLKA